MPLICRYNLEWSCPFVHQFLSTCPPGSVYSLFPYNPNSLQQSVILCPEVLTVEFLPHIALLPSTVYAFRLRVISPTLDQVRGRFWSLQTLNFNDAAGIS